MCIRDSTRIHTHMVRCKSLEPMNACVLLCVVTVSYTHLDVYKRQVVVHDGGENEFLHNALLKFKSDSRKVIITTI